MYLNTLPAAYYLKLESRREKKSTRTHTLPEWIFS